MLKVKDLIEQLSELNPDLEVWASKDAEGNGYNPVFAVNKQNMTDDKQWVIDDSELLEYENDEIAVVALIDAGF